jgi:methyl-accepting chemotaxis protein
MKRLFWKERRKQKENTSPNSQKKSSKSRSSLGKKLLSGFLLVLLLMGLLGGVGVYFMGTINEKTKQITEEWLPGVEAANLIHYLTENTRTLELQMLLEEDPQKIDEIEGNVQANFEQIDSTLKKYEQTITSEQDLALYTLLLENWQMYKELHEKFLNLASKMDLSKGAGIFGYEIKDLMAESTLLYESVRYNLDSLVDLNNKGIDHAAEVATNSYKKGSMILISIFLVTIALSMIVAYILTRSIGNPMKRLSATLERLANGDLTVEPITLKRKDEIGSLADSFNRMISNLKELIRDVRANSEQVAASAEQLTASAEQTSRATEQITLAIQEVAMGTDKQMDTLSESHHSITEIAKGMEQVEHAIQEVADLSRAANKHAEKGNEIVSFSIQQMNQLQNKVDATARVINNLGEKSKEIDQIVQLITDIANQTNLLALNAAIEAARAGEHGRGFAVVADEVRKLAEQSSNAAGEIRQLIQEIQGESKHAVESMNEGRAAVQDGIASVLESGNSFKEIANMIDRLAEQAHHVSAIVTEVSASAQGVVEMVQSLVQISEQTASNSQNVAAAAEEQNASMEEVTASAEALSSMASELQATINKFKI